MSENTRYVPAEATYSNPDTGEVDVPSWGVLDTVENKFAPFGASEELAKFAAERVAAMPHLPWTFVDDFTLAADLPRFAWAEATYADGGRTVTAWGAYDRKEDRFAPFADHKDDPDGPAFLADATATPDKYAYASDFTITAIN